MTTKHKRPNDHVYRYAVTHLVVTDRVADRLRRLARAEGRKVQWLADLALREWLDRHETQEGPA
jgi:predicted transcriptional regulator